MDKRNLVPVYKNDEKN